ncbi:hypothetical protein [Pectobacterium carotovorum]|uniref:AbiTii domain-containing protein n=1 Tax=Pectobacterium carotovorum TaxID=554 RepID=UPI00057F90A5|nr:hypothetical protein [Pectobacterium carotovorum]KHT16200.1 hypothetical protein RC96_13775 [Pectobacterium carotovorum subsp. carotovorum]KHT36030.1 hypothetical protein RC99_00345 [Pectobacterium carotovorum subsp. carotovorum]MBA0179429.1 hypothetical protein [Pectobacterium carotovorum]MBA0193869.1 hypothetical protein [Pectobacterium carotovorum]MBA0200954.1 hypothetical protein [Pectobacterium carotovorum]
MALIRSEHELELAKELLDDIEFSRLEIEPLFMKAARLARLCGSEEFKKWIGYEMRGYVSGEAISLKYMTKTSRWTNRDEERGYWVPLSQIESSIKSQNLKLNSLKTPNISGVSAAIRIMDDYYNKVNNVANTISTYTGIRSRALGILHDFVSAIYYEKELDHLAESIFEKYKNDVDTLISDLCSDVLQQIPSVVNRLSEGDTESVSQALTTLRRIIDNFADMVFPPIDGTYEIGGNELSLGANRHLNRLNAYVHQRVESKGRQDKIRQNLANLYSRVSTGVHAEVSIEEAQSLFLNCYLVLGEILHIGMLDGAKIA